MIVPKMGYSYIMYCDAFMDGLGCVLLQFKRVVAYGSRQSKNHEQSYPIHDMDLAAIVFALKSWHHYLYGEQFEMFSNHKSLKYILTQRDFNMRQRNWMEYVTPRIPIRPDWWIRTEFGVRDSGLGLLNLIFFFF